LLIPSGLTGESGLCGGDRKHSSFFIDKRNEGERTKL
jgi:hypothetical protein